MAGNRRRVGVALLLDPPAAGEVDGLRRALGDGSRERIPAHLTLVPPLNLAGAALPDALAVLRQAAAGAPPALELTLGPVVTFAPVNPVLYLAVGGRDLARLGVLRDAVFRPPLARPLTWPWVPHVTVADEADAARIEAAVVALRSFALPLRFDRVVLLEYRQGKWAPLADAALGSPWRVGTGGFALTLDRSSMVDPEAAAVLELPGGAGARGGQDGEDEAAPGVGGVGEGAERGGPRRRPLVVTARAAGRPVGIAAAWDTPGGTRTAVWVPPGERGQGIGRHLRAALAAGIDR